MQIKNTLTPNKQKFYLYFLPQENLEKRVIINLLYYQSLSHIQWKT